VSLTVEEVEKIAHLARLALTEAEKARYQAQMSAVLDYAARLNELDLSDVPPTSSAVALVNRLRDDVAEPCLPVDEALFNAPQTAQSQFAIQAILDD
jgi:aspartyl-tRNA(Asn)/glutamyl-tRNA(Gln) amidotransferase subunit C